MGWTDLFRKKPAVKKKTDWKSYFEAAQQRAHAEKHDADRSARHFEQRKKEVFQASTVRIRAIQSNLMSVVEVRRELVSSIEPDGYAAYLLLKWKNGDEFASVHDNVESFSYFAEAGTTAGKNLDSEAVTQHILDLFTRLSQRRT